MNFFPYYDYNLVLLDCFLEKSLVVCTSIYDFESEDNIDLSGFEFSEEENSSSGSEEIEEESVSNSGRLGDGDVSNTEQEDCSGNGSFNDISSDSLISESLNESESSATYIHSSENLTIDYSSYFENLQNIGIVLIAAILAGFASMAFMKGFKK